jgi:hypothetical protein
MGQTHSVCLIGGAATRSDKHPRLAARGQAAGQPRAAPPGPDADGLTVPSATETKLLANSAATRSLAERPGRLSTPTSTDVGESLRSPGPPAISSGPKVLIFLSRNRCRDQKLEFQDRSRTGISPAKDHILLCMATTQP